MATLQSGKTLTGSYTDIWCPQGTRDAALIDFDCRFERTPNVSYFPKLFGGERLAFRRGRIHRVHAEMLGSHVEGIQINGCRDVLFEDVVFEDNDVMHVFVTSYGGLPMPDRIYFNRCRFGAAGPLRDSNGVSMYWSVSVRDTTGEGVPISMRMGFYDCQVRGAPVRRANWSGTYDVVTVAEGQPWPAFRTSGEMPLPWQQAPAPPPPEPEPAPAPAPAPAPEPVPSESELLRAKLARIHVVLHDTSLTHKARVQKANAIVHE